MPFIPSNQPAVCPVCEAPYDSVTEHASGLMVGLQSNDRYRRVCFEPHTVDNTAHIRFYHHTHEQATTD